MTLPDLAKKIKIRKISSAIDKLRIVYNALTLFYNTTNLYPKQAQVYDGQQFDFIVVGGGTAGLVVANRLTETNSTVLVIEAGDLPPPASDIAGFFSLLHYSEADWNITTTNDGFSSQAFKARNLHLTQGKMLGGSSGLDYMFYVRGNQQDYDQWAEVVGDNCWNWRNVLPYFKKSENMTVKTVLESESAVLHGTCGNIGITQPYYGDRTAVYLKSFAELGNEILIDPNGFNRLGYYEGQVTVNNKTRQSTAVSYIRPIAHRSNLYILLRSFVTKIIFSKNNIALGVKVVLEDNKEITLKARKEVILSAGALLSPKLLMLSGIGPKNHLMDHSVKVRYNSPRVGRSLYHRPSPSLLIGAKKDPLSALENLDFYKYLFTFPKPLVLGEVSLDDKKNKLPDYQIYISALPAAARFGDIFCTYILRFDDKICIALHDASQKRRTLFTANLLFYPKSRGKVELCSKDPFQLPVVKSGFYSDVDDLNRHAELLVDYVSVVNTTTFKENDGEVINLNVKQCNKYVFLSLEYWKCFILNMSSSSSDFGGTLPMGAGENGVVDSRLKVIGVRKLRVVDASVVPVPVTGNMKATVLMLAEKASDIIKEDHCML